MEYYNAVSNKLHDDDKVVAEQYTMTARQDADVVQLPLLMLLNGPQMDCSVQFIMSPLRRIRLLYGKIGFLFFFSALAP